MYLFMYRKLHEPRPGTVCDFRGCDASVRKHYIKRDVGWRNEVKDFRCAEPDLFLGGDDKLCCRTLAQTQSRPARFEFFFVYAAMCQSCHSKSFYSSDLYNVEAITSG